MTHSHKSHLKQINKPFKGSRKNKNVGGRAVVPRTSKKLAGGIQRKQQRLNVAKALRIKRRDDARAQRRIGAMRSDSIPPKIVMMLPFKAGIDIAGLKNALASLGRQVFVGNGNTNWPGNIEKEQEEIIVNSKIFQPVTLELPPWAQMSSTGEGKRQRITLIDASAHLYPSPAPLPIVIHPKKKKRRDRKEDEQEAMTEYISKDGLHSVLDIAKTANVIMCVLPGSCSLDDPPYDELGYELLSALKLQGLPTPIGVMVKDEKYDLLDGGKQKERRKLVQRYFSSEFGDDKKFIALDEPVNDLRALLRCLASIAPKEFSWRAIRGYMLPDRSTLIRSEDGRPKLIIEGHVRGLGLTVKRPLHITGIGDVIAERIIAIDDPTKKQQERNNKGMASGGGDGMMCILEELTPEVEQQLKEEWDCLNPYDPLAGEQTWPTEEELKEAEEEQREPASRSIRTCKSSSIRIAIPKGTSEYQKAWFDEVEFEGDKFRDHEEDPRMDDRIMDMDNGMDNGMMDDGTEDDWVEGDENQSQTEGSSLMRVDNRDMMMGLDIPQQTQDEMSSEKKRLKFELEERSREDLQFPDEMDTPMDKPARERFSRYRGLKSFKSSKWNPYEDLPIEYSRIFEFESFRPTMNFSKHQFIEDILSVGGNMSITGSYVRLEIRLSEADPRERQKVEFIENHLNAINEYCYGSNPNTLPKPPLIISTLLPYERKTTVAHMRLTRQESFHDTLGSKAFVEMQCGFKRFPARPIYSSGASVIESRGWEKSKFERFFHPGTSVVASIFSPAVFPPAPVLMLKSPERPSQEELENASVEYPSVETLQRSTKVVAWGSVLEADPRRVIVKRIVLTGYPFRVHKKKAIVRFMFFNPTDIRWFAPVELCTKMGLRGHIKEPLGTHGYMKCVFNDFVNQSDTVCMYLYKRVFPKWFPPTWEGLESQTVTQ